MKWSVQQLNKLTIKPYHFEVSLDFSEYAEKVEDIISIEEVKVTGVITKIENDTVTALQKVEEFVGLISEVAEQVEVLNANAETEGSVEYKINNALDWKALS